MLFRNFNIVSIYVTQIPGKMLNVTIIPEKFPLFSPVNTYPSAISNTI